MEGRSAHRLPLATTVGSATMGPEVDVTLAPSLLSTAARPALGFITLEPNANCISCVRVGLRDAQITKTDERRRTTAARTCG